MDKIERPFRVSEAAVRGVALQVFILSFAAVLTQNIIIMLVLTADFAVRVFLTPRFSPLAFISRKVILPFKFFRSRMITYQPKRFAAMIGLGMTALALICRLAGLPLLFTAVMTVLCTFSALEAFLKFCAGCKIFGLLMKWNLIEEDLCPDCVFTDGDGI